MANTAPHKRTYTRMQTLAHTHTHCTHTHTHTQFTNICRRKHTLPLSHHMRMDMLSHTHDQAHTYASVHILSNKRTQMHTNTHTHTPHLNAHTDTLTHTNTHMHTRTNTHARTHTHTHTHTQTHRCCGQLLCWQVGLTLALTFQVLSYRETSG